MKTKAQLKDIVSYSKGYQINGDELLDDGKYDYLNGGVLPSGKWNEYNTEAETVTVSEGGNSCGFVNYMQKPFWCGAHCYYLYDSKVNTKYLYYILKSQQDRLMKLRSGACMPNIKKSDLGKFEVIYDTDSNEQQKVIDVLDRISSIITARQQELQKFDELIKARFVEMFGDSGKQVPLTKYVWFQEGPGVRSVDFTNEGTILLTGSNINNNTITFGYKSDRHISNKLANSKYAHFMCDKDDILVVSSAIDPDKFDKKVAIVNQDNKYCLNTGIIRFKPDKNHLTLGYFREFLKTDYFKHQVIAEMRGIAQMHFGPSHLKKMTILLPESIEKQIEFENFVNQIDKSKLLLNKSQKSLKVRL